MAQGDAVAYNPADALARLFDEQLVLQKREQQNAITVQQFIQQAHDVEKKIIDLEKQEYIEPEEKVAAAKIHLEVVNNLIELLKQQSNFLDLGVKIGLTELQKNYQALLLSLQARSKYMTELMVKPATERSVLSESATAKKVSAAATTLAERFKVNKSYQNIYNGLKYKKAGLQKSTANPILALSEKNLAALKTKLRNELQAEIKAGRIKPEKDNRFGVMPDELELFEALLNLPYKLQHATNHFSKIARNGRLDSLTEIHRHNKDFVSPFTTTSNIGELGNGGFTFYRCFVNGTNGSQTRYGNSRVETDLSLLREIGWVSLHDQLVPFPNQRRKQTHYLGKRILFQASPGDVNNKAQKKKSSDGIKYTYRTKPIGNFNAGNKDTHTGFEKDETTVSETISFTDEIFYGGDILPGIALSVIYRLRKLTACGYRKKILDEFKQATVIERTSLLGQLVKDFYRIEGKYPVSLPLSYNDNNQSCFFKPYAGSDRSRRLEDRKVRVVNPEGDGRLNFDLTINYENAQLAYYNDRLKQVVDRIAILQKKTDNAAYKAELDELKPQKVELEEKIAQADMAKAGYIRQIKTVCEDEDSDWILLKSYQYLKILAEEILPYIESEHVDLADFQACTTSRLTLLTDTVWLNFLEINKIAWVDLLLLTNEELRTLIESGVDIILEQDDVELDDVISCYRGSRLPLLTHSNWLDLMESRLVTWQALLELTDQELISLAEYNDLGIALSERGVIFDDLITYYREDGMRFECAVCDDLDELVLENAPNFPDEMIEFIEQDLAHDIDWEYVKDALCESDRTQLAINLGEYEEPSEIDEEYDEDEIRQFSP